MIKIEVARRKSHFGTYDVQMYRSVVSDDVSLRVKFAEACLLLVFFGAHRMYRTRLQAVRVKGEVYLSDFKMLVSHFLDEWSGKSSCWNSNSRTHSTPCLVQTLIFWFVFSRSVSCS